jgi:bifunctional non-homologous end joining protein LigD
MERASVAEYYKRMAKFILPHTRRRPMSFRRYAGSEAYWEKDAPSFTPEWVKRIPVPRREGGAPIEYIAVDDARTLLWLAGIGGIELHPFLHKAPHLDVATHVVFDLDPGEGAGLRECAAVALMLREALSLEAFAKVSGSKGIHVLVPLNDEITTHEMTEMFARLVADQLARRHPELIVSKMAKSFRRNKVFIDWSQNADFKTTAGVYSLRAETRLVSMPVTWEELESKKKLTFTPKQAIERAENLGDLFAPIEKIKQSLGAPAASRPARGRPAGEKGAVTTALRTQSGRRLFLVTETEMGNELWLDVRGKFKRFILRPDRAGGKQLIAMPAGEFPIEAEYYRAEVPAKWKGRVTIKDNGTYEVIDGSWAGKSLELFFTGRSLSGQWHLEKITEEMKHRSWRLRPGIPSRAARTSRPPRRR